MKGRNWLCALLIAVLVLTAGGAAAALGPVSEPIHAGIDISQWQGETDLAAVRSAGYSTVYIRSGYGARYTDPYFEDNARQARDAGLRFGFYHYVTARDTDEARDQASFFASLIQDKAYDCRPVMDFEDFSGLTRAEINAIGAAFLRELETLTGVQPMLYTDAYATEVIWDERFAAYPLWIADYGPREPAGGGSWQAWSGFQYEDDGRVSGIDGDVDRDYFTDAVYLRPDESDGAAPPDCRRYTVRPGDTLWAIARAFGTTVEAITHRNTLEDPDLIYPGETLCIPA